MHTRRYKLCAILIQFNFNFFFFFSQVVYSRASCNEQKTIIITGVTKNRVSIVVKITRFPPLAVSSQNVLKRGNLVKWQLSVRTTQQVHHNIVVIIVMNNTLYTRVVNVIIIIHDRVCGRDALLRWTGNVQRVLDSFFFSATRSNNAMI